MEENKTNSELIKKALDDYDKSDIDSQDINIASITDSFDAEKVEKELDKIIQFEN